MKIFLVRHASTEWDHNHIPYDILPGPSLSSKGEKEAQALAEFLKSQGIVKIYYSPFERSARTAKIVSAAIGIPAVEEKDLLEWRELDEPEDLVRTRMSSVVERIARESENVGTIGLVSHGGPIALLMLELGIHPDEIAPYRKMFDTTNPLPPAGVWKIEKNHQEDPWNFQLVFTPKVD
jgi:broad specificity phosphatase PhoE